MDKVLIVDDDEGVLSLLGSALKYAGYDVQAELSSIKTLEVVCANKIPVVVADIMMPEMDGLTLLKKIKEKQPECLVIFMTAVASLDSAIFAVNEGAFAYLPKPFAPDALVQAVKSAFIKVHLMQQNHKFVEELKAAKEYNETILKHLTYTVISMDAEGKIKKVNHAMEKLLDYTEAELLSQPMEKIFSKEFMESGWNILIQEQVVKKFPVVFKRKDGSSIQQIFEGRVMKDDSGKVVGFLGTSKSG